MSKSLVTDGDAKTLRKKIIDKIPFNYPTGGTTGMGHNYRTILKFEDIYDYLRRQDYGGGISDKWDCEDRAFWGVSKLRCDHPGIPVAVALDPGKHAAIYFWTDGDSPHCFDPDPAKYPVFRCHNFNPKVIIPFPVYRPNGGKKRKDIKPFDDPKKYIKTGAFVLDPVYDLSKVSKIIDCLEEIGDCPKPSDPGAIEEYNDYWQKSIEDRTFWKFIQIRRKFWEKYRGYSIGLGVAFGFDETDKNDKKDGAVLMIWGKDKNGVGYSYWHVDGGWIEKDQFRARIMII